MHINRITILITCLILINNIVFAQENVIFFEGQIVYDIDYKPYEQNFSSERLKEMIGSRMILTFKDGNFKKEFFSSDGSKLSERTLSLKDKKLYSKSNDSDTVLWIDITVTSTKVTFEKLKDSVVFEYPCTIISTKTVVTFDNEIYNVAALYNYAKDLPINPEWYVDFKEGNFYEIMKVGKGIAVREVNKGLFWEQKLEMRSISHRKVKNSEIKVKLNKKSALKELK
ncbi:hypothetical protein [Brumimicrobium mesophilum]|uniref:hypothetical protein n=1 Tax=Brumimicrobium mesophilum TaxID=392717 RepID=UPI000D142A68|nr:hypothetical protein [Brumimicrobium mesophilum]